MLKTENHSDHPKLKFKLMRNIVAPFLGIFMMLIVFGLLNSEYIMAQYMQRYSQPTTAYAESSTVKVPSNASEFIIPSLNLKAPIISEPSFEDSVVQKRLQDGVVRYGNLADFGNYGNVVLLGHSSGAIWNPGNYKYIFTFLDKVKNNDKIIVDYHGQRYIYKVTSKEVILPTNIEVLRQYNDKKTISLITCTPVGTNEKRLVVRAEQISPNPKDNSSISKQAASSVIPPSGIAIPN